MKLWSRSKLCHVLARLVTVDLGRNHHVAEVHVLQSTGDADEQRDIGGEELDNPLRLDGGRYVAFSHLDDRDIPVLALGRESTLLVHRAAGIGMLPKRARTAWYSTGSAVRITAEGMDDISASRLAVSVSGVAALDALINSFLYNAHAAIFALRSNKPSVAPDFVMFDRNLPDREVYYRRGVLPPPDHREYLKVCVGFRAAADGEVVGRVITAFVVDRIQPRERTKWRR